MRPLISPLRIVAAIAISPPWRIARALTIDKPFKECRLASSCSTSSAMKSENPDSSWVLLMIHVPRAGQTSKSAFRTRVEGMAWSWSKSSSPEGSDCFLQGYQGRDACCSSSQSMPFAFGFSACCALTSAAAARKSARKTGLACSWATVAEPINRPA